MSHDALLLQETLADTSLICSAQGIHWQQRATDARQLSTLMQQHQLPEIIARILLGRGITSEHALHFLAPTIKHSLPDPLHLKDMEKAAIRLATAIENKEPIVIFGDYDVDGATSSSLLLRFFKSLGHDDTTIYIPDRIAEGYGLSNSAVQHFAAQGARVIITVDCGTLSFEPIDIAIAAGIDVIVVDHHLSDTTLPAAHALINPNRYDETSPLGYLAAVGVAFLLAVAIRQKLTQQGWFTDAKKSPDLMQLLDIAALGTVCDMVPLVGLNRAFVAQGLKIMAKRQNIGIAALADRAGVKEQIAPYHLGFLLGPRVNAGGRVGKSSLGATLLSTADPLEAMAISEELDSMNQERKAIEAQVQIEAMAQAEALAPDMPIIIVASEGWHPGVIGIVAGRIKEKYRKPVAVIALDKNGIGKASARSITGFDFGKMVVNAKHLGLLLAGGGHAMAAGFSIEASQISAFTAFMANAVLTAFSGTLPNPSEFFDGHLALEGITLPFAELLATVSPFGMGNPEPRFVLRDIKVIQASYVGATGIKVILAHDGLRSGSITITATAFNLRDTAIEPLLMEANRHRLHLLGRIRINRWNGQRKTEFSIDDVALA
jgi:single-stranded-DNA-specific exonuclease